MICAALREKRRFNGSENLAGSEVVVGANQSFEANVFCDFRAVQRADFDMGHFIDVAIADFIKEQVEHTLAVSVLP